MKRLLPLLCVAGLLSGCMMYRLQELRQTTPQGTPFQTALSQLYRDFAEQGEKEYDWANSWHFADKGLRLAYGKDVPPEDLAQWDIPASAKPELEQARGALLVALTPETEAAQPDDAARAQFYFDCWVKYQDAAWQQDEIDHCHHAFDEQLSRLHVALAQARQQAGEAPAETLPTSAPTTEVAVPTPVQPASYTVFFTAGKSGIGLNGAQTIDTIVQSLEQVGHYHIILTGHTDGSAEKYNLKLSQARVAAVKKRLVEGGIDAHAIKSVAYGEADQAKGALSAQRRVDIAVKP